MQCVGFLIGNPLIIKLFKKITGAGFRFLKVGRSRMGKEIIPDT